METKTKNGSWGSTIFRILLTILLLFIYGTARDVYRAVATQMSSELSVKQLENSDQSLYIQKATNNLENIPIMEIVFGLILVGIWLRPAKRAFASFNNEAGLALLILAFGASSALASYSVKDEIEYKTIRPNETAFLIPEQGANKDSQAQFGSAEYLDANKVPTKRIQIKHIPLPKRGLSWDVYIPADQLLITTREPFAREWTNATDRGTAQKKEGFVFESKEGINIKADVAIAAYIKIENAAKYLYYCGVSTRVDPIDAEHPEYASTLYAKDLATVMDTVVRPDVGRCLTKAFASYSLIECSSKKAEAMATIEKELIERYEKMGITITYVGYASGLEFEDTVQKAIDNKVIAACDAAAAEDRGRTLAILQTLADVKMKEGFADFLRNYKGQINLPSFVVIPETMAGMLSTALKGLPSNEQVKPTK